MLLSRSYVLKHIVTADRLGRHPGFSYLKKPGMHLLYCIERFVHGSKQPKKDECVKPTQRAAAHLAVPVKAGLDHVRVFNTMQLNVPDAEIKTGTPRHQRHCGTGEINSGV